MVHDQSQSWPLSTAAGSQLLTTSPTPMIRIYS
jgi:hypothetical protein